MAKVQSHEEDAVASVSDSVSGLSNLSALENETDEFGRRILQHQREVRNAHGSDLRQPFSRARPRKSGPIEIEPIAQAMRNEHRHRRTASDGSVITNPPLNIPREWGRRARRRPDWLRSHESEGALEQAPKEDEHSIIPRKTAYTGDESPVMQWSATGDMVVPSIEHTPTRLRGSTSPWSLRHMNTTLHSDMDVEEQAREADFADDSLLTSTPAVNLRNRKVDSLLSQESEHTRNRNAVRKALSHISEKSNESGTSRPLTAPASQIPRRRQSGTSDKENAESHGLTKASSSFESALEPAMSGDAFKGSQKYTHARQDSMALLRKLARVTSLSPSPARDLGGDGTGRVTVQETEDSTKAKRDSAFEPFQAPKIHQPAIKAEPTDLTVDEKKKFNMEKTQPQATRQIHQRRIKSDPMQPKSALEDVLRSAKEHKDLHLGESTLASLEDIIHPEIPFPKDFKPKDDKDSGAPSSEAANAHRHEKLALEKLNKSLRSTRTTIKDANQGLRRIENKIEAAQWEPSIEPPSPTFTNLTSNNGRAVCEHCGSTYPSAWHALWTEFCSNFYVSDPESRLGLRLTWLGLACVLWLVWYTTETTLCSYYCHQEYAYEMIGYGVDPDAPDFPFVIPTLLFRPFKPIWGPVVRYLGWLLSVVFHAIFGEDALVIPRRPGSAAWTLAQRQVAASRKRTPVAPGGDWVSAVSIATSSVVERLTQTTIRAASEAGSKWEKAFWAE